MLYCTYGKLTSLLGSDSYDDAMRYHKRWVGDYLGNGNILMMINEPRALPLVAKVLSRELKL